MTLTSPDQAFDIEYVQSFFKETTPKSYQAIHIAAPDKTKPRDPVANPPKGYITVTFIALSDEKNIYRSSGSGAAIRKAFYEDTHRGDYLKLSMLYADISKITDPTAKMMKTGLFIKDNVKYMVEVKSKLPYTAVREDGTPFIDTLTGREIVTNNHTFFLLQDEPLGRALQSRTRSISTWMESPTIDAGFDDAAKSSVDSELDDVTKASDLSLKDIEKEMGL